MPLHPFLVHFAIALVPAAALFDLWRRARPGEAGAAVVDLLWIVGAAASVLAASSGQAEIAGFTLPPSLAQPAEAHEEAGSAAAWLAAAAALSRLFERRAAGRAGGRRGRPATDGDRRTRRVLAAVSLSLSLAASVWVLVAGHRGGDLVHRHGLSRATTPWSGGPARTSQFRMEAAPPREP